MALYMYNEVFRLIEWLENGDVLVEEIYTGKRYEIDGWTFKNRYVKVVTYPGIGKDYK